MKIIAFLPSMVRKAKPPEPSPIRVLRDAGVHNSFIPRITALCTDSKGKVNMVDVRSAADLRKSGMPSDRVAAEVEEIMSLRALTKF